MDSHLPKMGPSDFEMIRHLKVGWGVQLFENIWTDYPVAEPSQFAWSSAIGFANLPNRLLQMCPLAQYTKFWPPNGLEGSWITVKCFLVKVSGNLQSHLTYSNEPGGFLDAEHAWHVQLCNLEAEVRVAKFPGTTGHTWSWKQDQSSPSLLAHL